MTKILSMTSSRSRAGAAMHPQSVVHAADPLEPTQPLSSRHGHAPEPFPMVRPFYPAAVILRPRPDDFPHAA